MRFEHKILTSLTSTYFATVKILIVKQLKEEIERFLLTSTYFALLRFLTLTSIYYKKTTLTSTIFKCNVLNN